ncbi:hypothetical protein CDD83_7130 [Cordyceps sp. RAO-2017]|nr:hypothetical protein CDD83_7130 [Cordyceps sp. RAO-2017]
MSGPQRVAAAARRSRHGRLLATASLVSATACTAALLLYFTYYFSFGLARTAVVSKGRRPSSGSHGDGARNTDPFILHPERHIFREPRSIHLTWNVTKADRAPDGVVKAVYLINDQFPGPVIEARSGDELVVNVHNSVGGDGNEEERGISVHWHGLFMKGANEMDGVVGLTQCAIPPSQNFTYRFRIDEQQSGTFWYHAHSGVQRADGLYGGLVVHKPVARTGPSASVLSPRPYEAEQLLLAGDWYHQPAGAVLDWFKDPNHYAYEPAPDSLLINGRGLFNCSMAVKARPVNCSAAERPTIVLTGSRRVRLRVVNTGISSGYTISLTHGAMKVLSVDGDSLVSPRSPAAASVGVLYPGERMDVVVDRWASTDSEGRSPELSILLDKENMKLHNFALTREQSFSVVWDDGYGDGKTASPGRQRGRRSPSLMHFNLAEASGTPLDASLAGMKRPSETAVLYTTMQVRAASHNQPVGTVNHSSWAVADPGRRPLLSLDREEWAEAVTQPTPAQTFKTPWFGRAGPGGWLELVLNNFDDTGHPFHLHGYSFFVVSTGQSQPGQAAGYNPFDPAAASRVGPGNTANPLRKDTVYVPPMGYVVLRFRLDNKGLWLLHCHVLWHQAIGMGAVLQVGDVAAGSRRRAAALCSR